MLGPILAVTFTVVDLNAVEAAYGGELGYEVVDRGTLGDDLATLWNAPAAAGSPMLTMAPAAGEKVPFRFIERPPVEGYTALHHHGWNAAEIIVADVDALAATLATGTGFTLLRPPADLSMTDTIRACQVAGPAGEILYLTEVKEVLPIWDLPQAESGVEGVFIVISGGPDVAAIRDFYKDNLGLTSSEPSPARVSVLSQALGAPLDTEYPLAVAALPGKFLIEMDEFPAATGPRPCRAGDLPPGQAIVSFACRDLTGPGCGFVAGMAQPAGSLYDGARAALAIGAAGEWIELIERHDF